MLTGQNGIYKNVTHRMEGLKRNHLKVRIENLKEQMYKKAGVSTNTLPSLAGPE